MGSCRILHDMHMYHHLFELSFRYRNHTLVSHNFLIRTYRLLLTCFQLPRSLVQNLLPSKLLRSLWIQNPMVSYRSAFAIGSSYQEIYPHDMLEALAFFCHRFEREESRKFCLLQISLVPWADSSSVQQKVRSSAWYWQRRSVSIYCWVWVPPPCPMNWATLTARKSMSLNGRPSPVHSVQEWSTHEYFARNR